jgi:hypothetical protein
VLLVVPGVCIVVAYAADCSNFYLQSMRLHASADGT